MMRLKKRSYGFSLLELCTVVAIIGILASIALPKYLLTAEKGRLTEAKSILSALRGAQVRYMAQMEHFTNVLADLDTQPSGLKYFTVNIAGIDITQPAALLQGTQVATCVRNTVQNVNAFPAGYVVSINQLGTVSSSDVNVQQRLI
jgi:prepilin-type N-terminal cleavage/methylation domain-containing protein